MEYNGYVRSTLMDRYFQLWKREGFDLFKCSKERKTEIFYEFMKLSKCGVCNKLLIILDIKTLGFCCNCNHIESYCCVDCYYNLVCSECNSMCSHHHYQKKKDRRLR